MRSLEALLQVQQHGSGEGGDSGGAALAHFPPSPSRSPLRLSSSRPPSPFSNPPSPNGLTAAAVLHTLALRGELQKP